MSSDTTSGYAAGFGRVSRTVGVIFRYLLLAATLVGIVALAILLVYVTNDAIQPLTADPGWHLTFFLTLVVPTVAVGGYLYRRNSTALGLGVTAFGLWIVSLMFGGGVAMLFVDVISPITWLAYVVALAVPLAVVVAVERIDGRVRFAVRFGLTAVTFVGSLLFVPNLVRSIPVLPTDGLIVALTLGGPVALIVGWLGSDGDSRRGLLAGTVAFVAALVAPLVAPLVGLTGVPAAVLASVAVVPTGAYVVNVIRNRPADRIGLVFPAVIVGGALLGAFVVEAVGFAGPQSWLDWQFLTSNSSNTAEGAGLYPAIVGSVMLMVIVATLSFPLGVGAAVYLEEYAPDNRFTRIIDVNISNLAGVPSVVYGLLGLGVFVTYAGRRPGTVFIGGATLALLILPIIIISSREAIRSVPSSLRAASYGMGATRWQTVKNVVLPRSFSGMLTGTILALGRAIGETAPLIMIGAPNVFDLPTELTSRVGAMPLQIYAWATLFASDEFYQKVVPAGVVTLLVVMLAMNSVAIALRNKYQRKG